MTTKQFLVDLDSFLKNNFNAKKAEKEKAYLYSDAKHYGIYPGMWKEFTKSHEEFQKNLSKDDAVKLGLHLWEQPSFEEKMVGIGVILKHKEDLTPKDMPMIEKIMKESKGWAYLDSWIIPVMPSLLEKYPKTYDYLKKWIKDDDFWARRSALLAQLLFFRQKGKGDFKLFFEFAESQFDEKWIDSVYKDSLSKSRARFFIRKAIGWTLRDMSKNNPDQVIAFLKKNKSKMSGLSFKEGSRKLPIETIKLISS